MYKSLEKELNLPKEELFLDKIHVPTTYETTIDNLKAAIVGEHMEYSKLYPEMAEIAEKEGFANIAAQIRAIAVAEEHHEEVFKKLLNDIEKGIIFERKEKIYWLCRECGYIHYGTKPPKICPSCNHPQSYFEQYLK